MRWHLDHVNLPARDVRATAAFYAAVLDMDETPFPFVPKGAERGDYLMENEHVAYFEDEAGQQVHIVYPDADMPRKNKFYLNPVLDGHLAIGVDDIEEVKRRLTDRGIYYADAGSWSFHNHYQIYCYDPANNVVEINQRLA